MGMRGGGAMGAKAGLLGQLLKLIAGGEPVAPAVSARPAAVRSKDPRLAHEIRGESHYQDALSEICGGKTPDGHLHECQAELRPEPDNPHDPNAVAVFIADNKVGYLPRLSAKRYGKVFGTASVSCPAKIVGGWRRREGRSWDEGSFGVELDLRAP